MNLVTFSIILTLFCSAQSSRRIFGGDFAKENQFPHYVYLTIKLPTGNFSYCGGSAINKKWVLTVSKKTGGGTLSYASVPPPCKNQC